MKTEAEIRTLISHLKSDQSIAEIYCDVQTIKEKKAQIAILKEILGDSVESDSTRKETKSNKPD